MRRIGILVVGLLVLGVLPASAGQPDVQRGGMCQGVQPRARAHLELTDVGDRIEARFVVHQMTQPGHLWRVVLRYGPVGPCCTPPGPGEGHVFFEGTRVATGGDLVVQRSVVRLSPDDFFRAKARDRHTGQFCRVRTVLI